MVVTHGLEFARAATVVDAPVDRGKGERQRGERAHRPGIGVEQVDVADPTGDEAGNDEPHDAVVLAQLRLVTTSCG